MRTITRRDLSHESAKILDEVLASGEPVEVVTRGRRSLVISLKPESQYEQWKAQGLVKPAGGHLTGLGHAHSDRSVQEMLDAVGSDH